ncbi:MULTISPECIES: inorganic phosphate transporter [Methylosinus]|uniref:Phosphate transporter n=1 Tax=Methylosinus trichosporium (strain ATCC 35070 / NCIMB 11131 / UNIQEM 75 / OB3b) TaxID=595536 RepID=A0A2D2D5T9_METT3|nr:MULTISPECIES: inorganic phosphate transporter [Methylosinus]ATQ70332.1 inorganic phosphate transporter [Methylosinus trichosporium OB3b]OBS50990.1 nuclease PIN [Methylosinus sp. 3S-1]
MTSLASSVDLAEDREGHDPKPKLDHPLDIRALLVFLAVIALGLAFTAWSIYQDLLESGAPVTTFLPFVLLGVALFIALGFEFVNGFHDTANAVATVIYTHSMPAPVAVVWSGFFNFLGVLFSTGAVAFGIVSLLPVELILQVGSQAGFAMVFALLIAAIMWNLGTWWLGLPASSSHTLIGSIIGVGIANALMRGRDGTSGVDWGKAIDIGYALLLSPVVGFVSAALLLLALKFTVRKPELYQEPKGQAAPPWWIRGLLVLTCTGVSFAHGSNDGQKGMGLIMLILIGTVPTSYALNRALPPSHMAAFSKASHEASEVVETKAAGYNVLGDPRPAVTNYVAQHQLNEGTYPSLAVLIRDIANQIETYGSISKIPFAAVGNTRNDIYLASEALRFLAKDKAAELSDADKKVLKEYKDQIDQATKFIPLWVKIAVAIALGLGTMIGWRRIVVTVGEKIGKQHLTYGQGASAELVAMGTIAAADMYGMPVSTTHVLSSGVAGTMAANGAGVQMATIQKLLMAWVLTLPAAITLSASLYFLLRQVM